MRRFLGLAMVLMGCTSAPPGGGIGAGVVATSGGAVGSACPGENDIGCAPGAGGKVRCTGGKWLDDGTCAVGQSCAESQSAGKVVATACAAPVSSQAGLALACAKVLGCTDRSAFGMEDCVNLSQRASMMRSFYSKLGLVLDLDNAVQYDLVGKTACLAGAKDCAGVGKCLGAGHTCKPGVKYGCTGSVAWKCMNDVPLGVDCASLGLQCGLIADQGFCGKPAVCAGPEGVTCAGDTATVCVKNKAGFSAAQISCGAIGYGCDPKGKAIGCSTKNPAACDGASYLDHCEGAVRKRCIGGMVASDDCGLEGKACVVSTYEGGSPQSAKCTWGLGCDEPPACDGNQLAYCESGKRAAVDCVAGGMICLTNNGMARCGFAQ